MLHGHHSKVLSSIATTLCRVDALVGVLLSKRVLLGLVNLCWPLLCEADVAYAAGCGYDNVCRLQTEAALTSGYTPAQCASMISMEAITREVSTEQVLK